LCGLAGEPSLAPAAHQGHRIILASRTDGSRLEQAGLELDPQTSREIFQRSGGIQRLDVFLGLGA